MNDSESIGHEALSLSKMMNLNAAPEPLWETAELDAILRHQLTLSLAASSGAHCAEDVAKLILVGEGPDKEKADLLAKELGVKEKILFLGKSDEIRRIMCFSDLFLLPSETESFGLASLALSNASTRSDPVSASAASVVA